MNPDLVRAFGIGMAVVTIPLTMNAAAVFR